jgi:hypothetical protein
MAYIAASNSSGPLNYLQHQCAKANVEYHCAESFDVSRLRHIGFSFRNVGLKLVRIVNQGTEHFLEPGESVNFQTDQFPQVEALNNGL